MGAPTASNSPSALSAQALRAGKKIIVLNELEIKVGSKGFISMLKGVGRHRFEQHPQPAQPSPQVRTIIRFQQFEKESFAFKQQLTTL